MNRIREVRSRCGMSQKDLANRLNIHQTAVSQWEMGRTAPRFDAVESMGKLFSVSSDYLLGLTDDPTPPGQEKASALDVAEAMADKFMDMHGRRPTAEEQSKLKTLMDAVIKGAKDD